MNRKVKPFFLPFSLVIRQIVAIWVFTIITRWPGMLGWIKNILNVFRISAGSTGIGCFGVNYHYVFELTSRCNLACKHCHVGGEAQDSCYEELDTIGVKKILDDLAALPQYKMIVLSGGEPLVRDDIFEIIEYSRNLGFYPVLATNATLIDQQTAISLKKAGIYGIATSIDSINPAKHDEFRGNNGSLEKTLEGIKHIQSQGLYVQINTTISKLNIDELEEILKFTDQLRAHVVLLYQLILTGRGRNLKDITLNNQGYRRVMETTYNMQSKIRPVVIPVGLPEYFPYLIEKSQVPRWIASKIFKGCIAGKRGTFYIKPNADVWPCPMLPVKIGNLVETQARDIWKSNETFNAFDNRKNNMGICGECANTQTCGGCRARAFAKTGDPFGTLYDCPLSMTLQAPPLPRTHD